MNHSVGNLLESLVKDWKLKALALVLAALSYYAIQGAIGFEIHYEVPVIVEVEHETGIAILDQDPQSVEVTFRGSQEDLRQLDQQQLKVVVHPKATSPAGSESVILSPRHIEGAPKVRVVKVRPSTVTLVFDREAEKKVAVIRPTVKGSPLIGRVELDYEPRFVTLRGPRQRLKEKEAVSTEPIDVDGRVESFVKKVRVLRPGDTWLSNIEPSEITVNVNILMESASREWKDMPVLALVAPGGVVPQAVEPPTVKVILHGHTNALDKVGAGAIKTFVDCRGLAEPGSHQLAVNVHLSPGVDVAATIEPEAVSVMIVSNLNVVGQAAVDPAGAHSEAQE